MKTQINLKKLISKSGLRIDFIAKQLGISYIYLHYIINDRRKSPAQRQRILDFILKFNSKAA